MQEQNFEKQVQQKMEEFSLTPSVPVWQKVEQEIQQKKKRRRVLIFWLFPFVLVGGGIILWNEAPSFNRKNQVSTTITSSNQPLPNTSLHTDVSTTKVIQQQETPNTITTTNTVVKEESTITNNLETLHSSNNVVRDKSSTGSVKTNSQLIHSKTATNSINELQEGRIGKINSNPTVVIQKEEEGKSVLKTSGEVEKTIINNNLQQGTEAVTDSSTDTIKEEPITSNPQPKIQEQKVIAPINDTLSIQKGKKKETKWSIAVQAAFGISSLQSDLLAEVNSTPQVRSDFALSNGAPIDPAGVVPGPSAIEKGMNYQFSFLVKRSVSKRVNSTIGIQYSRFTTLNKIGKSVSRDTVISIAGSNKAIDGYYQTGPNSQLQNYTNRYHFLELPLAIEWQLLKSVPLHLQAGTHLSYLVASNGLVYDARARIYYHNKDVFNRLQVHFNSGLTYRVWKQKQWSLHAGPYFQYGITNLQKDKLSNNYHLFATGIKTQISF